MIRFLLAGCALCSLLVPALGAEAPPSADGLPAALRLSATLHPSVKSKLEELKALGYDLQSAEAKRYPTFSLQANTTSSVASSANNDYDQHALVAIVQQPLWVGGRIDGSIDQASVRLNIGKLALLATKRQLMESTAATYANVLGARQRLAAAELNVMEHERLMALITRRESGGITSSADVLLASSRLSSAQSQRIQLEALLQRSLNDLQALTQQPLPASEPVPATIAVLPEPGQIVPDIEKASATVQQRLLEVELARIASRLEFAGMQPTLHARVEQDMYRGTNNEETPNGTRIGLVLQGSVEGLGFSGWKKIKSADARMAAAGKDVEAARNETRRLAQSYLNDLRSYQLVLQSNDLLVKSTEETLASFMRQYDAGRKSWVDVLNTQRELAEARLALEQSRSSLLETRLRLAVQLGLFDIETGVLP